MKYSPSYIVMFVVLYLKCCSYKYKHFEDLMRNTLLNVQPNITKLMFQVAETVKVYKVERENVEVSFRNIFDQAVPMANGK